ncbi:Protein C21orf2 [Trypanosoma theileri]|uniref:Protein C21orf2 n=1 Tax=Trypanosoma theileri TaxID=67003 RepID=A0A1X0P8D9_9TRYP|nr:Protein C21orf2 [Trypanosoma theileri]ORC93138.1 Protein C21orf2 [Trypanosoma theileri]
MILKEQFVLETTKATSLAAVRNLNLWSEGLTDVSIISKIPGIEVLSLSSNQVSTMSPFASCTSLRELYLRKNNIQSLSEVKYIKDLPHLHTLWLLDNPCATHPNYRYFVINCCPHLRQLDSIEVTKKEREEAMEKLPEKVMKEMLQQGTAPAVDAAPAAAAEGSGMVAKPVSAPAPPPPQPPAVSGPPVKVISRPAIPQRVVTPQSVERRSSGPPIRRNSEEERKEKEKEKKKKEKEKDLRGNESKEGDGSRGVSLEALSDGSSYTTIQTQRAILTAIVSLIPELTIDSLGVLQKEVVEEMARKKKAMRQMSRSS